MNQKLKIKEPLSRRDLLKRGWIALGIIAGLETIYIIFHFLFFSKSEKNEENSTAENLISIGQHNDFKPNSVTSFRKHRFFVACLKNGDLAAYSILCTHLGCSLVFNDEAKEFQCPCHRSQFDIRGNVLQAPATRPLNCHPIVEKKGQLFVNTSQLIKRNLNSESPTVFKRKV